MMAEPLDILRALEAAERSAPTPGLLALAQAMLPQTKQESLAIKRCGHCRCILLEGGIRCTSCGAPK